MCGVGVCPPSQGDKARNTQAQFNRSKLSKTSTGREGLSQQWEAGVQGINVQLNKLKLLNLRIEGFHPTCKLSTKSCPGGMEGRKEGRETRYGGGGGDTGREEQ